MTQYYNFGTMSLADAKALNGKVASITTWADKDLGESERHFSHVRVMHLSWRLLLLADDAPGPADQIYVELVKTVEVHDS